MAIVRSAGGGGLERRVGTKVAAKHAVKKHAAKKHPAKKHAAKKHAAKKHAAKKHAAKKHAAKKHAEKHAAKHVGEAELRVAEVDVEGDLAKAYHHLQRSVAVISLVDAKSGGDLRILLEHGERVYRIAATGDKKRKSAASAALGLLRATEHLVMAGFYEARSAHRVEVPAPTDDAMEKRVAGVRKRLRRLKPAKGENSRWLQGLAEELAERAAEAGDVHLGWEMAKAADAVCMALEEGM